VLPALPLSPHGKVDRGALARAQGARLTAEAAFEAPRNPTEEALARIWRELLGIERVGIRDNFFDLGGHSLLTTQLASRLRDELGVEVPLHTFFEEPRIARLAESVELARWARQSASAPVAAVAAGFEEGEI